MVGEKRTFVVDTGFDAKIGAKRQRAIRKPIDEGLEAIGIEPDAVKDVIVTHLHYDHTGNYDMFPNARYHLQDCEMAYATGRCMCHAELRKPFEAEDVTAMVRKVFEIASRSTMAMRNSRPASRCITSAAIRAACRACASTTRRGPVVLASDASHYYAHIEQGRVFPLVYNVGDVLEGYEKLKRLAGGSGKHVVPGHDPLVLKRYPAAKSGLEGWIARLDAEPTQ